eukprot:5569093-Pyramimonas_sp.AAC.1
MASPTGGRYCAHVVFRRAQHGYAVTKKWGRVEFSSGDSGEFAQKGLNHGATTYHCTGSLRVLNKLMNYHIQYGK